MAGSGGFSEYDRWRESQGLPRVVPRYANKRMRSVNLSDEAYAGLQMLSERMNIEGPHGKSVSSLIEAIGLGMLRVSE